MNFFHVINFCYTIIINSIPLCDRSPLFGRLYCFQSQFHVNSAGDYAVDFLGERDDELYLKLK